MGLYLIAAISTSTLLHFFYMAIGLGFVIFVHELGHFLVAKACGVKCEKFYLGFDIYGLRLFRFRYGETEYGIGALPLGGYVKMLGQDDNPANAEAERQRSLAAGTAAEGHADGVAAAPGKPALDPRSFQAKNVPQRMAIISAGVIMNLIFAVIFAAVAYRMGVEYTPCIIGGTVPGDSAWKQNWEPGTQILQIGRNSYYDDQLRFDKDLKPKIILNGDKPIDLFVRLPSGEEKWITITPTKKEELRGYASLGIRAVADLKIDEVRTPHTDGAAPTAALAKGDRIRAVNKTPVKSEAEYLALMYDKANEKVTLEVERPADTAGKAADDGPKQTLTVELDPRGVRWLGVVTKLGPVTAVRPDSPAAEAGFHVGDVLLKIGGEPVGDPVTLARRIYAKLNEPLAVEVERADAQGKPSTVTLTVTPKKPICPEADDAPWSQMAVESIGLTYGLTTEVAQVAPNSPAAVAGLKVGDVITGAEIVPTSEANRAEEAKTINKFKVALGGTKGSNWFGLHKALQWTLKDTGVKLSYTRGEEDHTTEAMVPAQYAEWHDPQRGIELSPHLSRTRTAESWSEAASLGVRETYESMGQVLGVLQGIVMGRVRPSDLGGPLSIAAQATSEAAVGISSLLIFLTLLSANLAIVNFLPIPVLDGGHFVFLAYEGLRGKPPNERVQLTLTYSGLAFLLLLMAFVFSLDLQRAFTWFMG